METVDFYFWYISTKCISSLRAFGFHSQFFSVNSWWYPFPFHYFLLCLSLFFWPFIPPCLLCLLLVCHDFLLPLPPFIHFLLLAFASISFFVLSSSLPWHPSLSSKLPHWHELLGKDWRYTSSEDRRIYQQSGLWMKASFYFRRQSKTLGERELFEGRSWKSV